MNETIMLDHLEQIAAKLGVDIRYENLGRTYSKSDGGYCKLSGKEMILINRKQSRQAKIRVLARSLKRLDLNSVFIPPAVRAAIESQES
jgi:hypothetical protein